MKSVAIQNAIESIEEALSYLPERMDSTEARVMLIAIGLQESALMYRRQLGNGPARGLWQFERGGGVHGVLQHHATAGFAFDLCAVLDVRPDPREVWNKMERDDVLAAGFARLLLWSDPSPLPKIGDVDAAWELYLHTWRPGKPHVHTWRDNYNRAVEAVEVA